MTRISKSNIKARTIIAQYENDNIEKDINDTNLYVQEYLFKKLFLRTIFIFLVSFCTISYFKIKEILFMQELFNEQFFLSIFVTAILLSLLICIAYCLIAGICLYIDYVNKQNKVKKYMYIKERVEEKAQTLREV